MKRLIVFSTPKTPKFEEILENIFPQELENKILAYLPVEGRNCKQEFITFWEDIAKRFNAEFLLIDNTSEHPEEEREKLMIANILIITGGNTFELLNNVRQTGLDGAILNFAKKDNFVIAGWSAGALLISPSIEVAGLPWKDGSKTPNDKDKWKTKDLSGLNLIDFEIYPHYEGSLHKNTVEEYTKRKNGKVRALTNDQYVVIDF
jgi:peptidase E